jgi:glycyl-tRNA synthetase beta subunit
MHYALVRCPFSVLDEITSREQFITTKSDNDDDENYLSSIKRSSIISPNNRNKLSSTLSNQSPLQTPSVVNWHKSYEEIHNNTNSAVDSNASTSSSTTRFMVDDVPMFIANQVIDDYFVVL